MSGCLGHHLAALADGSMPTRRRERALAHVAACDRCRRALEAQRAVRACLASATTPQPPRHLTDRLLDLPLACWLPPDTVDLVTPAGPAAVRGTQPPVAPPGTPSRTSRLVLVGGTASIVTAAGLAALAAAPTAATSVPVGLNRAPAVLSDSGPAATASTHGISLVTGTAATAAFVAPASSGGTSRALRAGSVTTSALPGGSVTTGALPGGSVATGAPRLTTVSVLVRAGVARAELAGLVAGGAAPRR